MKDQQALYEKTGRRFRPVRLVFGVCAALLLVSSFSRWYAEQVSVPRYCQQPELVLQRLAAVFRESGPSGVESRRDYVVAAKLGFIRPPAADESLDVYLSRLRLLLKQQCEAGSTMRNGVSLVNPHDLERPTSLSQNLF